MQKSQIITD